MSDPVPSASASASDHPPTSTSTSAEDRKAAAALSSLNTTEITNDAATGTGTSKAPSAADQEALGKAMSRLEIASGGSSGGAATGKKSGNGAAKEKAGVVKGKKAAGPAAPPVKVAAEDVGLLVSELDLTKVKATELLKANGGDAKKAIRAFIRPQAAVGA
ncbi:hypothetical protein BJX64DRAFT_251697 [Aspergillus heterothallicus]